MRNKSWLWNLTWPFAHNNWTLIGPNILYCPKNKTTPAAILKHEEIHAKQMKYVGVVKYYFLYLFCFPLFLNPWREKWEMEAYVYGSGFTDAMARARLNTAMYGWIGFFRKSEKKGMK